MRPRGSLIGNIADPTQYVASGVWSPIEMLEWRHKNKWPIAGVGDALDPSNKNADITLSNANRTATKGGSTGWGNVRGLTARSSGKYYFEVEAIANPSSGYLMVGVDAAGANLNTYHGANPNASGYQSNGNKWTNDGGAAYGSTWTDNDVIGVAMDFDGSTITYFKNNVSQGIAHSSFSGTKYPCVSLYGSFTDAVALVRLQAAHLVYSPPGGYSAWVDG